VAQSTVILEWTFTPPNYFEEAIEVRRNDYVMTIADGKAEARIDADVFDRDSSIRQALHNGLNDRFLAAQLLTHQPYTLSKSSMVLVDPDGKRNIFLEMESIVCRALVFAPDLILTDKDGNVVKDTRRDRIEKKKTVAELIQQHRVIDALLDSVLKSYQASVKDPDNELVHLYEIRDALVKKFGDSSALRTKLGITRNEWSRFAQLANDEPLRQGRHRGSNAGNLRDATEGELQEARSIARKMVETYLRSL
jgi:hypothetical protein